MPEKDEMVRRRELAQKFLACGGDRTDVAMAGAHAVYLRDERIKELEEQLIEAWKEPLGRVLADKARGDLGPSFVSRVLPIHGSSYQGRVERGEDCDGGCGCGTQCCGRLGHPDTHFCEIHPACGATE